MGWGRTLLLGDVGNRLDIEETERDISRMREDIRRSKKIDLTQDQRIASLENENAVLKLYLASSIRLLIKKGLVTTDEIRKMVEAVDGEDGIADGKYDRPFCG